MPIITHCVLHRRWGGWVAAILDIIPMPITIIGIVYCYRDITDCDYGFNFDDALYMDMSVIAFLLLACHCLMSLWFAISLPSVHQASVENRSTILDVNVD